MSVAVVVVAAAAAVCLSVYGAFLSPHLLYSPIQLSLHDFHLLLQTKDRLVLKGWPVGYLNYLLAVYNLMNHELLRFWEKLRKHKRRGNFVCFHSFFSHPYSVWPGIVSLEREINVFLFSHFLVTKIFFSPEAMTTSIWQTVQFKPTLAESFLPWISDGSEFYGEKADEGD